MVKISDLKTREIINIIDGRRLGVIKDVDIDLEEGRISALILPGAVKFMGFLGKEEELIIPWDKVRKIGLDVILVEINPFAEVRSNRNQQVF